MAGDGWIVNWMGGAAGGPSERRIMVDSRAGLLILVAGGKHSRV